MKSHRYAAAEACSWRSQCPIANALDLFGDKWTLVVIRDLLFAGKRLYGEIIQSEEGIPSNILADRLKRLEEAGLVTKKPYQRHPLRYEYRVTPRGADLAPVFREITRWANKHIPGTGTPPPGFCDEAYSPSVERRKKR
jgi:DNA-binding HxlR family transcriptional regulator